MWKDGERAKKRQKTAKGKVAVAAAAAIGEEAVKEEGEIWDEEALDALFNEIVRYLVMNSYVSAITELYAW
jgi:hypothetical protein